jgi:hypothetical protein
MGDFSKKAQPYNPLSNIQYLMGIMNQGNPTGSMNPSQPNTAPTPAAPMGNQQPVSTPNIQDLIAPCQEMARKAYPSNILFGNSGFAQNHPRLAGALSNAFLAASMTKPGMTPGENISNVASGVLGASQASRQQLMKQQMMPYEMLAPQIALQKNLADIQELNQRSSLYGKQGDYYAGAKTALTEGQAARQNMLSEGKYIQMTDDNGHPWSMNLNTQEKQPIGWTPAQDYAPTFKNDEKGRKIGTATGLLGGGLQGRMYATMFPPDNPDGSYSRETMQQIHNQYVNDASTIAGGRTQATEDVKHPLEEQDKFLANEEANYKNQLPAKMPFNAYQQDIHQLKYDAKQQWANYQTDVEGPYQQQVRQADKDFANYKASVAPAQKVGFQEYQANTAAYPKATAGNTPKPVKSQRPSTGGVPSGAKIRSYDPVTNTIH